MHKIQHSAPYPALPCPAQRPHPTNPTIQALSQAEKLSKVPEHRTTCMHAIKVSPTGYQTGGGMDG